MLEKIIHKKKLLALIVRGKYRNRRGITFFTPNETTQQFGYMKHKTKHIIKPHLHKRRLTKISYTTEVILILKGKLRVDFYNSSKKYLLKRVTAITEHNSNFKRLNNYVKLFNFFRQI